MIYSQMNYVSKRFPDKKVVTPNKINEVINEFANEKFFYTPRSTKLLVGRGGGILDLVCLPALYLLQYSPDPFHIYTPYQATSEGVLRVKFFLTN